jgi:hypothetical protein
MVNKIFSTTFALALLLTQVAHALPQGTSFTPPSFSSPSPFPASPTVSIPTTTPSAVPNAPQPNLPTPSPLRATYDPTFDNSTGSMDSVACSNGDNGLETTFPTFGDVPSFPFIGGAYDIVWNSPNCGSCWNITNPATGLSIRMTAIDTSGVGFNLALEAFANLTNGDTSAGVINVVANKVSPTPCPAL